MPNAFEDIVRGRPVRAAQVQPVVQRARELTPLFGRPPIHVATTPFGTTIRLLGQLQPGTELTVMKITGTATRGGVYEVSMGTLVEAPIDPAAAGAVTLAEFYTFPSDDTAWFLNIDEVDADGHAIPTDTIVVGWERGTSADGHRLFQGGPLGVVVRYGKATTAWTSGNTITLTPVKGPTDGTPTGEANVTAYIISPRGASPTDVTIAGDDILAYLPDPTAPNVGQLMPITAGGGGGGTDTTDIVTNVSWDDTNHQIKQTKVTIQGTFTITSGPTTTVVTTADPC